MADVTIVSGPPGAGKTTICAELSKRFDHSAHIRTDAFFTAIQSGFPPWRGDAAAQNHVCIRAAARAVLPYVEAGFEVFVDGVIRPDALRIYEHELSDAACVHYVLLFPTLLVTLHRGRTRDSRHRLPRHVFTDVHRALERDGYVRNRVDSTGLSVPGTADVILERRASGTFRIAREADGGSRRDRQ